jgi:predicted amidohydrolase YtcJ
VHLLAMAAERLSVDCRAALVPDIPTLLARLARAGANREPGEWVRATGFDDALVAERRLPTRQELDEALPDTPLVLHHRTGHLELRNAAAGDGPAPALDGDDLADAMRGISVELARMGVVELHDATPSNLDDWRVLSRWVDELVITQELTVMPGVAHLDEFADAGLHHGSHRGHARLGPAKVLLPATEIEAAVRAAHERDWPVAVHVMDIDELAAAVGMVGPDDRLEHVALSLPEQVGRIAATGATVVTQPSFLVHRRAKYMEQLTPTEHGWLYRVRSLLDAGVTVHLSSDAPVVPADPDEIARAAVERDLNPAEAVDADTAYTLLAPSV